jgi:hypothetical protein
LHKKSIFGRQTGRHAGASRHPGVDVGCKDTAFRLSPE